MDKEPHTQEDFMVIKIKFTYPLFQRLFEYVEKNLSETISLGQLASIAKLSRYALCRFFRIHMGMSPMRWLLEFRVLVSLQLFSHHPEFCHTTVATHVGFSSASHLAKAFRTVFAQSPTEAKKNLKSFLNGSLEKKLVW